MGYSDYEGRGSRGSQRRSSGTGSRRTSQVRLEGGSARSHVGSRSGGRGRSNSAVGQRLGKQRSGYPIKSRSINFQGNGSGRVLGVEKRLLILGVLAVVLIVLVVLLVSSCVSSCASGSDSADDQNVNAVDSRVAAGVDEDMTQKLAEQLDQNEAFATIAAKADQYSDQGLLELALSTPEAVEFVAAYPDADKTAASEYGEYTSGSGAPELYCWDSRWGNMDYAGRAFALTGSGPTSLAMAYIGLKNTADVTPAAIADAATAAGAATGDSCMSASFLESECSELGLSCTTYVSGADNLTAVLDAGTYLLIEAKAGTLTDTAHWVLLVTENNDGSVVVYDPTSPSVSEHPWDAATLAASCDTLYAVSTSSDAASE